eukprot:845590-Pleurochrysis_carterae.AAC.1
MPNLARNNDQVKTAAMSRLAPRPLPHLHLLLPSECMRVTESVQPGQRPMQSHANNSRLAMVPDCFRCAFC